MRDHAQPVRIQLSRATGWRMPPNTVKADRTRILGNPWLAGEPGQFYVPDSCGKHRIMWRKAPAMDQALTVEQAVALHADWLHTGNLALPARLSPTEIGVCIDSLTEARSTVLDLLSRLRGCNFACWCKPGAPCHADNLMEIANQ